jgi:hypothetical protein
LRQRRGGVRQLLLQRRDPLQQQAPFVRVARPRVGDAVRQVAHGCAALRVRQKQLVVRRRLVRAHPPGE